MTDQPADDEATTQAPDAESTTDTPAPAANADVADMSYEEAREELVGIVATLERGERPLEESMELWERGEALADHCATWLDTAQQRITERVEARQGTTGEAASDEDGPSAG